MLFSTAAVRFGENIVVEERKADQILSPADLQSLFNRNQKYLSTPSEQNPPFFEARLLLSPATTCTNSHLSRVLVDILTWESVAAVPFAKAQQENARHRQQVTKLPSMNLLVMGADLDQANTVGRAVSLPHVPFDVC